MGASLSSDTEPDNLKSEHGDTAANNEQSDTHHIASSSAPFHQSEHGDTAANNEQSDTHHIASSSAPSHPLPYPPSIPNGYQEPPVVQKTYEVTPTAPTAPRMEADAPPLQASTIEVGRPWKTGLFDCGEDDTNAVVTVLFPCVTFGQIAEILDEGETSCTLGSLLYILMAPALCTCCILGLNYRQKLRKKYNLVQAPAEDWVAHLFCPFCSLCQEFRELKNRGIDPSLGWMGYLAQQQETTITVPPNGQSMNM